uniref:Cystatin domain-containing protein n=1 Tax=Laticauda laticaudata TaxID=8630 RepID=A0A8C5S483_LATLA
MVRSQLPVAASLRLLCALLLLLLLPSATLIPGGLSPRSVTDPDVQKAAAFAVQEYNALSANAYYYKELRIVEAQSQVCVLGRVKRPSWGLFGTAKGIRGCRLQREGIWGCRYNVMEVGGCRYNVRELGAVGTM